MHTARRSSLVFGIIVASLLLIPQPSQAAQVNVGMGPNYFTPPNLTVNVGDTVVWTNTDTMQHNVTANDTSFVSGTLQPGAVYSRTFTNSGTYFYNCTFHAGMVGSITVVAATPTPSPTPTPSYTYSSTPTPVPQPTADSLYAQAQSLLARVQQLQQQLGATTGAASNQGSIAVDKSSCPLVGRSLKRSSKGDDVTRLQQFLARDSSVYPEGQVTGFYGALTEAAVKRWQIKYNIVSSGTPATTGYGVVGPRTAAAIAILCSTGSYNGVPGPSASPTVGGFIQVTPIAGNAPLVVAVQATVNTVNSCNGATYIVDWGDRTQPQTIVQPVGNCAQQIQTLGHTYPYGGVYQITLLSGSHRTSATVQVFGAGPVSPTPTPTPSPTPPSSQTLTASPASGNAPLGVTFSGIVNSAGYSVDFGDGTNIFSTGCAHSACPSGAGQTNVSVQHTYGTSGTYTAKLRRHFSSNEGNCYGADCTVVGTATVTVAGTAALEPFVVTPGINSDPFSVQIDFTIRGSCSPYDLDWGDATAHIIQAVGGCTDQVDVAKKFEHTYSASGSYTITLARGAQTDTAAVSISAQ